MRLSTKFAASLWAIAASSLLSVMPATAMDDAMMPAKIDCAKADEMLSNAQKMGTSMVFTGQIGEIDRIILPTLIDREKGTNMMLHVEAECGKDPKMKAMAAKAAADSDARMKMLHMQTPSQ